MWSSYEWGRDITHKGRLGKSVCFQNFVCAQVCGSLMDDTCFCYYSQHFYKLMLIISVVQTRKLRHRLGTWLIHCQRVNNKWKYKNVSQFSLLVIAADTSILSQGSFA